MTDEGRVEGTALYVYGSVTADGREMNGDTVKGTWASKGCDSSQGQLESGKGQHDTYCENRTFYILINVLKVISTTQGRCLKSKMQDDRTSMLISM
jgi:hypothetical protein